MLQNLQQFKCNEYGTKWCSIKRVTNISSLELSNPLRIPAFKFKSLNKLFHGFHLMVSRSSIMYSSWSEWGVCLSWRMTLWLCGYLWLCAYTHEWPCLCHYHCHCSWPCAWPCACPCDSAAVFLELITGILMSTKSDLVTNFMWVWFVGGHTAVGMYFLSGEIYLQLLLFIQIKFVLFIEKYFLWFTWINCPWEKLEVTYHITSHHDIFWIGSSMIRMLTSTRMLQNHTSNILQNQRKTQPPEVLVPVKKNFCYFSSLITYYYIHKW